MTSKDSSSPPETLFSPSTAVHTLVFDGEPNSSGSVLLLDHGFLLRRNPFR